MKGADMRLIDADALIERKFILHDMEELTHEEFEKLVNEQPTAFDTEKVVAELEQAKGEISLYGDDLDIYCNGLDTAIDIVKRGGIE